MAKQLTTYDEFQEFFKNSSDYIIETLKKNKELLNAKSPNNSNLLHWACSYVNKEVVKYLIEEQGFGKRVNELNEMSPLHFLCSKADNDTSRLELIKYLVGKNADVNLKDNNGNTSFHVACGKNANIETIKYLVENKSEINLKNKDGNTPLYMTIHNNAYIETIIYLVESKADANSINNDGKSSLHKACADNVNIKIIQYLVGKTNHANIKIAICAAWAGGALEKINGSLISGKKFDSNEIFNYFKFPSENQNSKFWKSTNYEKSLDQVSDEIKEGLELNFNKLFKQIFFKTFIDEAMQNGCQIMFWDKIYSSSPKTNGIYYGTTKNISIFIDPKNMDFTEITGTIFHELEHFYNNHEFKNGSKPHGLKDNALKKLWSELVDEHVIPSNGVFHAICKGYDKDKYTTELPAWIFGKLVEEILNNNSDWMTKNFDLVRAVWDNILKGLNNDLTLSDFVGEKVLNKVLINKITIETINIETIKYLVQNKADLSSKNSEGDTPLHLDCYKKNAKIETIKCLVENKADVNLVDKSGYTPLHTAFLNKPKIETIKYLVENKSDVNSQTIDGHTPLHLACFRKNANFEIIKYLFENKADLSAKANYGNTPLHLACFTKNDNIEIIKYLVENKADLSAENDCGNTPDCLEIISAGSNEDHTENI